MDGRAWFVVAAFFVAAAMVLSNANCGYDEPWPPQKHIAGGADSLAADPLAAEADRPADELCVEAAPEFAGKEVIFAAPDSNGTCEENGMEAASAAGAFFFAISEDSPQQVTLYGRPSVEYCLLIERKSGYVTISHPNGEVRREGNRFTWCVVPVSQPQAETMLIRSLTARAEVELSVL